MTVNQSNQENNLFKRPSDDVYSNMEGFLETCRSDMNNSREVVVNSSSMGFEEQEELIKVKLEDHYGIDSANLTHYSLGQVAAMAKIPVQMIERLSRRSRADLIVDNLNTLFPVGDSKKILYRTNPNTGEPVEIRAVNGSAYARLWDHSVFSEIEDILMPRGFIPRNIHAGAYPLYRGDQTSFGLFTAQPESSTVINGHNSSLGKMIPGVLVWNSEVGARSFGFHTFYLHEESGAIIVWTPSNHKRKRYVHRGNIQNGFREYLSTVDDVAEKFESRYVRDLQVFSDAMSESFAPDTDHAQQILNEKFKLTAQQAKHIVTSLKDTIQYSNSALLSVWNVAFTVARLATSTNRAETMVDESLVATRILKRCMKIL